MIKECIHKLLAILVWDIGFQIYLYLCRFSSLFGRKLFKDLKENECIICKDEIEYNIPAPLCDYDWTAWWHHNSEVHRYLKAYEKYRN